jgi:hypothetical protein
MDPNAEGRTGPRGFCAASEEMILRQKDRRRTGVVAALCLVLAACASTSGTPQSQQASLLQSEGTAAVPHFDQSQQAALLLSELTRIDVSHSEQSIYYLGLALYSETWSQNDVVDLAEELSASVPTYAVRSVILSNYTAGSNSQYPLATSSAVDIAVRFILNHSEPDDLVVVAVSTHGGPGLLAQEIGQASLPSLSAEDFRRNLSPLANRRTIIILSSCYSASLIPSLKMANRIIITSARSDRTSFGCQADAEHTVFGQAMIDAFARSINQSLYTIVAAVRAKVAATEAERHFSPPSEPQVFVGTDMHQLYSAHWW